MNAIQPTPHTVDQRRASGAYTAVETIAHQHDVKLKKDYGGLCLKLPALIHQCGLCQALAFYQAKANSGDNAHSKVLKDLAQVVLEREDNGALDVLLKQSRTSPLLEYLGLTRNAMACSTWFKRYAEALLKEKS